MISRRLFTFFALLALMSAMACNAAGHASANIPSPALDASLTAAAGTRAVVLAGGCFWGMQELFEYVRGVTHVTAGYSGGARETAKYDLVSTGKTGHAESVEIFYDPSKVSFGTILKIFFSVAHDPTQLNRQRPDSGTQYRSAIFFTDKEQERIARAYIAQLDKAKFFEKPIATQVAPLKGFYPAEEYHQNYAAHHPDEPYIVINDAPKVVRLRKLFPDLCTNK